MVIPTHRTTRTVPFPQQEVAQWMARPGAVRRLTPPWIPMRVQAEAEDLRDGTATFTALGVVPIRSQHQPEDYTAGQQFADVVELPVVGRAPWRHVHRFTPTAGGHTRLIDEITAPVSRAGLERAASYRSRQISGDLAYHRQMRALLDDPHRSLTIAMTGASGLIGTALTALLTSGGHRVIGLTRENAHGLNQRRWDPERPAADLLHGVDALVHLAGAPIAGRFSAKHKRRVRDSRVGPTAKLAALAGDLPVISASGIGYYGAERGDEVVDEAAAPGGDEIAQIVQEWEAGAAQAGGRFVLVRTGIVQSAAGGATALQLPLYRAGLGGPLGSGRQWLSWIGIDDLIDIYYRAIVDSSLRGAVNAVAPHPVRQQEWARVLGAVLGRPAVLRTPGLAPAVLLGREGAKLLALASQRVAPRALREAGHTFRFPSLHDALAHEVGRSRRSDAAPRGW